VAPHRAFSAGGVPSRLALALAALVLVLVCFVQLGNTAAFRPDDESYHVGMASEMYARGAWWAPTWFGRPALNKPPLTFWLFFAGFALQGVSIAAARLPMALLTVATVLVTARLGRSLYGPRDGLIAGLLTLTSLGTIEFGRSGMTDVPLYFLFTLAAWALWEALATARPGWWGVFFAAAGLSTLAKGPFSLILIGLFAVLVWVATRPHPLAAIRHPLALAGLLVGVLAVVSWPLGLWRNGLLGEWYRFFVVHENLGKFQDQYYPPSVLLEYLLVLCFPWLPLVAAAAWIQLRGGGYRDPRVALPLAWIVAVLVFHAVPATKLQHYVLPAVPGCALLVASAASRLSGTAAGRLGRGAVAATLAVVILALLAATRLLPEPSDRLLSCLAAAALAAALWAITRNDLVRSGLAYGAAVACVLAFLPALTYSRLPETAVARLRDRDVVVVKEQVWVFSLDLGRRVRQITTRREYDEALSAGALVIVAETDLLGFVREGADRQVEQVDSWPQWKRTLPVDALVRALASGRRDELVETVRVLRAKVSGQPAAAPALRP
jgi:4-amino-4-deoxy-L-arabinose transferase-like glycosyltransferase